MLAIILTAVVAVVYATYFYASISMKEEEFKCLNKYPPISIVFPAYNEEKVIEGRIKNIAQSDYSGELELIIVNDASDDGTEEVARNAMDKFGLCGRVNFTMAKGIREAKNEIVVCTDADVTLIRTLLGMWCQNS